jgi:hypothetical protein
MSGTQGSIVTNYLESMGNITRNKELATIDDSTTFRFYTRCVMVIITCQRIEVTSKILSSKIKSQDEKFDSLAWPSFFMVYDGNKCVTKNIYFQPS